MTGTLRWSAASISMRTKSLGSSSRRRFSSVGARNPLLADDGYKRVALADAVGKDLDEIEAGRNIVNVEKDAFASEPVRQAIIDPSGEAAGIFPSIAYEDAAQHIFTLADERQLAREKGARKPQHGFPGRNAQASRPDMLRRLAGAIEKKALKSAGHQSGVRLGAILAEDEGFESPLTASPILRFLVRFQVDEIEFSDGKKIILLSEGCLVNLANATGHPSFVMSVSFTRRRSPRSSSSTKPGEYKKQVYTLPKRLDEKVASLHFGKIGAKLTKLTHEQSKYLGVPQNGPFKSEQYRY